MTDATQAPRRSPPSKSSRPAIFLDRDGTLIREANYLSDPDQVVLLPGVPQALRTLVDLGYLLVVITNQSGIARGFFDEAAYRRVAARFDHLLEAEGVSLAATLHCPHHPEFSGPCDCRKPGLALYRQAIEQLDLEAGASHFVGDKLSDVLPAQAFSGTGWLVRTGHGRASEAAADVPSWVQVVDDLTAVSMRLRREGPPRLDVVHGAL